MHDVLLNLQHILLGQGRVVGHGLQLLELRHLLRAQHDDVLLAVGPVPRDPHLLISEMMMITMLQRRQMI